MKKKTEKESSTSKLLFKLLLVSAVGLFAYIFLSQPEGSYSISENKLRSNSDSEKMKYKDGKRAESVPSNLKWVDSFKGVSNE